MRLIEQQTTNQRSIKGKGIIYDINDKVTVDSSNVLQIPVGETSTRPATPVAGDIRYNTTTLLFEHYDGVSWKALGQVSDRDGDTYIVAETASGADEDTLRFVANSLLSATIDSTRLDVVRITVDDISIDANTIQTETTNTNLLLDANGTGTVEILSTTNVTGDLTASGGVTAATFSGDGSAIINVDAELFDGQDSPYYLDYPNFTNRPGIFKNFSVVGQATGYTWSATGVITADVNQDTHTATIINGSGLDIEVDAANDALRFQHSDTSSAIDLTTSRRRYVSALSFDTFGHVTGYDTSVDIVILGTETSGNYVATASGSNGISIADSGTETANITVSGVNATTTSRGVASFDATNFSVTTGEVTSNPITLGTSSLNLGVSTANVQGLTLLEVDSLSLDGQTISTIPANTDIVISPNGTGNVDVAGSKIINLADPSVAQDAASKAYVDATAEGLTVRQSAKAATTASLDATYDNGVDGVGATLTANTVGAFPMIDGVGNWELEEGVLVKDQTNAAYNGRYDLTRLGSATTTWELTRSPATDQETEIPGTFVFVRLGDTQADTGWVAAVTLPMTVGTTDITFDQFSGSGTYTAGVGLTLDGTQFNHADTSTALNLDVNNANGNVVQDITMSFDDFGHVTARTVVSTDLDLRYYTQTSADATFLTAETDTLDSVTTRGSTTTNALTVGGLTVTGNILPNVNNTLNVGSSTLVFNTMYATTFNGTATQAQLADLAENYKTDEIYEPGTVVMFGGVEEVTASDSRATRKVAGIISTAPAYLMNTQLEDGQPVALKGRVPCKVVGPVRKGDMLIASDIPGVAMASEEWIGGAMIGKSIETNLDSGAKVVEVAVGVL